MADKVYEIRVVLDGQESINTDGSNVSSGNNLNSGVGGSGSGLNTVIGMSSLSEKITINKISRKQLRESVKSQERQFEREQEVINDSLNRMSKAFDISKNVDQYAISNAASILNTFTSEYEERFGEYPGLEVSDSEIVTRVYNDEINKKRALYTAEQHRLQDEYISLKKENSLNKRNAGLNLATSAVKKFAGAGIISMVSNIGSFVYNEISSNNISNLSMGGNNLASRNAQLNQSKVNNISSRVGSALTSAALGFSIGGPIGAGVMAGIQVAGLGVDMATAYPKYQRAMREYEFTTASSNYMKDIIANRLVNQTIYRR